MKTILLTGSGGFIGSHLKNFLSSESYNLLTPRSSELNLLDKNAVKEYVESNNPDFIVHSASYGVRITADALVDEIVKPNIEMFNNLADLVSKKRPMITIGSGAEYDKSKSLINVKEDDYEKTIPKDPYGYSKYLISKEIEKRENILNLRVFGIYGSGEHPSRVTSCIIDAYLKNEPLVLNQNVKFHFIYIDDFCKIVKHFIDNPTKEKFLNVTPDESIEIIELAKIFDLKTIIKKKGLNKEYTANNSRLRKELGKFEFTSYEVGMKKFYEEQKIIRG